MAKQVALLGLGTMGVGMAENMLAKGISLAVYNRTFAKAEALTAEGARAAMTPAEAVEDADIVISMLADDDASRAAWFGDDGALSAMKPGAIAIESSTASPDWIAELDAAAKARGVRVIDAPVTGSRPQAEAGQLTFLTGGDAEAVEEVKPVLTTMSKEVLHLGPVGSGAQLKLINNFLCGVQVVSFAQGLAWIERNGLDRAVALDFLKRGAPGSGIFAAMAQRMTERTYEVNFVLKLMAKDMRYAQAAAAKFGVELTTAEVSEEAFKKAEEQGHAEQDMSAVAEIFRQAE